MAFTFIATSDVHLGRSSSRLPRHVQNERGPTTSALSQISSAALQYDVDAVAIAGDLIDDSNHFLEVYDALDDFFKTLLENEIHVIVTAGNHDFDTLPEFINHWNWTPSDTNAGADLILLNNSSGWEQRTITNKKGDLSVQFMGWSFPTSHYREDPVSLLDEEMIKNDRPTIALVHGDLGNNESIYAPLNLERIKPLDVQAWILGHIHKPEIVHSSDPFICYPGSPKPLSPKESGSHHLTLVTCRANQQIEQKAVAPSLLYYQDVTIELSDDLHSDSLRSHCVTEIKNSNPSPFSSKYILAKVILTGRFGDLERINELEQELVGNKFGNCYIHSVESLVEPALNLQELATEKNPAGILAKALLDIKAEQHNTFIESLRDQLKKTRKNLEHSATFSLLDRLPAEEDDDIPDEDVASDTLIQQAIYRMLYQLHQQKVKSEVYDG